MANNRTRYEQAMKQGNAFNQQEKWKDAFSAFRVAIAEFSKEADAYAGLGEACFGLKQLDRALECYKLAARYSKGDLKYLRQVADIQERLGRLAEAGRTYMAIGEMYLKSRQLEEAISNWQRAVRLEPHLLGPHRRLAMVYQRQNMTRDAVREYLAIARILQAEGDDRKALQMCKAALRLDPDNQDVLTAVDLIRKGAGAYNIEEEEEEEEEVAPAERTPEDELPEMVRQMAEIFEAERQSHLASQPKQAISNDPVDKARRYAQDQLAEEIFREDDQSDSTTGLSKLERDALIGQAMDFESRNQVDDAINCYERAISGGLRLGAAYFSLGLLYVKKRDTGKAKRVLEMAARDPSYAAASKKIIGG